MLITHYLALAKEFGWTPRQIDEIELVLFFDLLIVANGQTKSKPKRGYIDQVLF